MYSSIFSLFRGFQKRRYVIVMTFLFVMIGVVIFYVTPLLFWYSSPSDVHEGRRPHSEFSRALPTRLLIEKIGLDAAFVPPLPLLSDQTVAVPDSYSDVGWYQGGVSPGETGSAVILGHVDSIDGPAVFFSLGQLEVGDTIVVERADATVATFLVEKLVRYAREDFPTQDVYGPTEDAVLRLVTCTGKFDKSSQLYTHNLVVYARLAK